MATEIEAKMQLRDRAAMVQRLAGAGGLRRGEVVSTEVYLDQPDGSLRAADCGLRVRMQQPVDAGAASGPDPAIGAAAWLTYKGPRREGPLKVREEIETTIGDGETMIALLVRLGFRVNVRYQKRRETWELGGCLIELDDVPLLGEYIEIEGPDEATVQAIRERLGLGAEAIVKPSYVALLMGELESRGDDRRDIRLED